ncbi:MAG TPA: acetate--CoA ligase [Acidobacteria bacterium]|nr:acetate--CoA ligase [Acidobacteriota bacterium]HIN70165.1 acetate--CoA ligase [Acidobacteriota bacterium]
MAKTSNGPRKEIDALLDERRTFAPPSTFSDVANVSDSGIYDRADADPEAFWEGFARELEWIEPWSKVLDWNPPNAKWFVGGKINASVNCIDRHVRTARRNKAALIWEGEPGDRRTLTYFDLYREVNAFGGVLKSLGVRRGDRVALYMPLVPELAIAMLACARIGAVHSVVFGGFSAESLRDRINDLEACVLVTADGGYRRGQVVPLKQMADDALRETPSINHVVVVRRQKHDPLPVTMQPDRDHWYHELMMKAPLVCEPEVMDAEDLLYILYTSGTTGKPKGIVHTTGGYLVGTYATTKWVFDLKEDDVYWCTADIGWVTGHSYLVYGPLANGATAVMYEGAPDWPAQDRLWEIVERYGVTIFYTAPTAIRTFMRWGTEWLTKRDLSSLRLLGSVGEPINPEAWMWYYEHVGRQRCPVVDTWWQTETGAILITPLPGLTTLKPGSASRPFPGITAEIRTSDGQVVTEGGGLLAITKPWPSMLRGIYGDPDRFVQQYWSQWSDGMYFTGDGAKLDADGYFWLLGRVDDVLNVAGHRIGTMEVESALVDHSDVAEAAVVGCTHKIKGQAVAAFVTIREGVSPSDELIEELKKHVVKKIGAIARPDSILFASDLPKTRSGKIMRRLLRDIADGKTLGDTTTLADPSVVARLQEDYADEKS